MKSEADFDSFVALMLRIDRSRSSLGHVYEKYIHAYMTNYKDMNTILTVKDSGGEPVATLEEVPVCKISSKPENDVAEALRDDICSYIIPVQTGYPALDSFYVCNGTVYCFQITTSRTHEQNHENYDGIKQKIETAYLFS